MPDETLNVCVCVQLMTVEPYKIQRLCRYKQCQGRHWENYKERKNCQQAKHESYKINESIRVIILVVPLPVDLLKGQFTQKLLLFTYMIFPKPNYFVSEVKHKKFKYCGHTKSLTDGQWIDNFKILVIH